MAKPLKLEQFGGELPAWDQRLLPPGQAAFSENGYLFSGSLKGWRKPKVLRTLLNSGAKMVFRLPTLREAQALAYLLFKSQPNAGDTATIGDVTYVFVTDVATADPGSVKIGVNVTDTVTNLIAAISADGGTDVNAGILYANNTLPNDDVKWYEPDQSQADGLIGPSLGLVDIGGTLYTFLAVGSPDFGLAYNLTAVAESTGNVRTTWLQDLLALSDTTTTFKGGANAAFDNNITGAATWLEFDDADTNVLKSQTADDKWQRYYTASPSQPPKYNPYDRIKAGQPFWLLGVPPPGCAPLVSIEGGGNSLTMGSDQILDGEKTVAQDTVLLMKIIPTGDVSLSAVTFTTATDEQDKNYIGFKPVLYADNNGIPGDLIAVGDQTNGVHGGGTENTATFTNPTAMTVGFTYWIGIMTSADFNVGRGQGADMVQFPNVYNNGPPATAPAASSTDGILMVATGIADSVLEGRSYVYTWITGYDEESPPSPATLVNGWSNGVWTIGLWQPPPNDVGILRNITGINIYRTVVATGGAAVYYLVTKVDVGTETYIDTLKDDAVALSSQLPSTNWFPPPENLQGILAMPNGVMAGFADNQIWFCDPYHPHAWPPGFVLTTEFPIVGIGLTNGALVACTSTVPYVVNGVAPGSMTLNKCGRANPCASRGSITSGDDFVTYMSQNGLIQVSPQGVAVNTTDRWFTREQWQKLVPQRYSRAIHLASCYFCYGSTSPADVIPADNSYAQDGFTIELDEDGTSFTIWPQPGGHRLGFNELTSHTGENIDNVLLDPWTGIGLLVSAGQVWYYDFSDQAPLLTTYQWKSKIYQQNAKKSYEAMKVFFTVPPAHDALNEFRIELPADNAQWLTLPSDRYGYIRTYVDVDGTGELTLMDVREIRASGELLRIRSGFKCEQWQWEIIGNINISNVQIALSAKDLAGV